MSASTSQRKCDGCMSRGIYLCLELALSSEFLLVLDVKRRRIAIGRVRRRQYMQPNSDRARLSGGNELTLPRCIRFLSPCKTNTGGIGHT